MKVDFEPREANAVLDLMRQGVKTLIDGPNSDGAIDAYVLIRDKLVAAAKTAPPPPVDEPTE